MKIVEIKESPLKHKRYRVTLDNGKHYDFGLEGGSTYIDHHNVDLKERYWARHYGNKREKYLIDNLILSPSLLSAYLLWGKHKNLIDNVDELNKLLVKKYE